LRVVLARRGLNRWAKRAEAEAEGNLESRQRDADGVTKIPLGWSPEVAAVLSNG
jgi:hypothetical protein